MFAILLPQMGGSGPLIALTMMVGMTSTAWLCLASRDARQRGRQVKLDAQAREVEQYVIEGRTVESLDATGRIIKVDDDEPESAYGTRRVVGLPHAIIQGNQAAGPRRLSQTEGEEIERLVKLTYRRLDYMEVFLYFVCGLFSMVFWLPKKPGDVQTGTYVVFGIFALGLAQRIWERWKLVRIRRELRRGKREGQVVGLFGDGKHLEVLGRWIPWTVDGRPSEFRTRWMP